MPYKKHSVLVTGGAGFIGSVLCQQLMESGYSVRVFDAGFFSQHNTQKQYRGIDIIKGDIRTPPPHLFDHIDSVIHLAAISNDPTAEFDPDVTMQINTTATKNLAVMAKSNGVSRFLFASSCSIYDMGMKSVAPPVVDETTNVHPTRPYSLSKYLAEQELLLLSDIHFSVTILRKGTVFGFSPRMRYDLLINTMIRDALSQGEIHIFCYGKQWRPLVSINHVSAVYQSLLEVPIKKINGQIFNISDGNFLVKDVAEQIVSVFLHHFKKKIHMRYEQNKRIDRSYRVSTSKAEQIIGFTPCPHFESILPIEIQTIMDTPYYQDFSNPIFYNIQQLEHRFK